MRQNFKIGAEEIAPGQHKLVDLPVAKLANHTPVFLPVHVFHGKEDGPTLFVSAAVHGDEVIGVEIIQRLMKTEGLQDLRGTLLCIPIVNAYGFISHTRYLPDRRDLNRCFPGKPQGALAEQLAHIFMTEIVSKSDFGIDLHTAALHRTNLPQIRSHFAHDKTLELAKIFGAPVMLESGLRPGSLREAAFQLGVDVLVFEAGEALRLDEFSVRSGTMGVLRVMNELKMLPEIEVPSSDILPVLSRSSKWVRAGEGGLLRGTKAAGDSVVKGEVIATIVNPYEDIVTEVTSVTDGLVIGRTNLAVVNRGDALFHVARVAKPELAEQKVADIADELDQDPIFDEDEIL